MINISKVVEMSPKQIVVENIRKQQEAFGLCPDTVEDLMGDSFDSLQEYLSELIESNK